MVAKLLIGVRKPFKQLFFLPSERFFQLKGSVIKGGVGFFSRGTGEEGLITGAEVAVIEVVENVLHDNKSPFYFYKT